ncbi:MAG TPA: hypothetical protein ACFCUY_00285 [Xenococcaceae cyanobacterium]
MKQITATLSLIALNIVTSGWIAAGASAQEIKKLNEVEIDSLISETQVSNSDEGITLVWWIPQEFWGVALNQDPSLPAANRDEMLKTLEPYFMLAVIQGELSSFGGATFYDEATVQQNLTVSYEDETGNTQSFTAIEQIPPDIELLQSTIRPMLSQMMGNMGQNFHFYTFENTNPAGEAQVSPYENGTLQVQLAGVGKVAGSEFEIELPLDALFVPRLCPNGKEAHVSWQFCPWDGTRLSE